MVGLAGGAANFLRLLDHALAGLVLRELVAWRTWRES
jgi:hypothetical protein